MVWISSLGLGGKSLWPFYFHIESTSCWANSFTSPPSWGSTIVIGSRAWDDQMEPTTNMWNFLQPHYSSCKYRKSSHYWQHNHHQTSSKQKTTNSVDILIHQRGGKKRSGTVFATFWSSNLSDCPSRLQHFGAQTFHVAWYFATRVHLS